MPNATDEILKLEKQYWQAIADKDFNKALELTSDPCIVIGAQGVAKLTRQQFKDMMAQGRTWTLEKFDISDVQVEQISDDVAIVGYKVHEDMTVEGRKLTLDAAESSTWIRKNGSWTCALHSEAIAGDPFGRDKMKKAA
jgi:hypothetical protein